MNYREYWWKSTKEVLSASVFYLTMIGTILLAIGMCALIVFLAIKYAEYSVPIFGVVLSIIIIVVILFGCMGIIFLFFNYHHYRKHC